MADFGTPTVQNVMRHIRTQLDDFNERPQFSSRLILAEMRNAVLYMADRGIRGSYLYSSLVTLTAGTVIYTASLSKVQDDTVASEADLLTEPLEVQFVRRHSDGLIMSRMDPLLIESALAGTSLPTGKPTHWALFRTAQSDVSYGTRNSWQLLIDAAPTADDLPESLDIMVNTRQSLRFDEHAALDATIAVTDSSHLALILRVAAKLVKRALPEQLAALKINPVVADDWMAESESAIAAEASRFYLAQVTDDIVMMER